MSAFDALDFFQAHQVQERQANRARDEARDRLERAQEKLDGLLIKLSEKRRDENGLRLKLVQAYSSSNWSAQIDLVSSDLNLSVNIERKVLDEARIVESDLRTSDEHFRMPSSRNYGDVDSIFKLYDEARDEIQKLDMTRRSLEREIAAFSSQAHQTEIGLLEKRDELAKLCKGNNDLLGEINQSATRTKTIDREIHDAEQRLNEQVALKIAERVKLIQDQMDAARIEGSEKLASKNLALSEATAAIEQLKQQIQNGIENKNKIIDEYSHLQNQVAEVANMKEECASNLVAVCEELEVRLKELEDETPDMKKLWDERRTEQIAIAEITRSQKIDPKKEHNVKLRMRLQEMQESFAKMVADYVVQHDLAA